MSGRSTIEGQTPNDGRLLGIPVNTLVDGQLLQLNLGANPPQWQFVADLTRSLTPDRALQTSGTGVLEPSVVTATELGFVSGVTSAIQTQIDTINTTLAGKQDTSEKGAANGYASLDAGALVPVAQIPDIPHTKITDFDAGVQTNRLDQMALPTSNLDINSNKLVNVTDPTNPQDGATKNYVDGAVGGATITTTKVGLSSDFSTNSQTYVDVTGLSVTLTNVAGGGFMASSNVSAEMANGTTEGWLGLNHGGIINEQRTEFANPNERQGLSTSGVGSTNGGTVKIQTKQEATTTITIKNESGQEFHVMEVS